MLVNYVVDGLRGQARSALLHVDRRVEFYERLNSTDLIPHFCDLGHQQSRDDEIALNKNNI
jgi:hypothetical protein